MSIADRASLVEGNGVATATIDVTLSAPSTRAVRVGVRTADGNATAGADYQGIDTTLTFAAGETLRSILISIFGDTLVEGDEAFTVTLSAPENATLGNARAVVTIVDDDRPQPPWPRPVH